MDGPDTPLIIEVFADVGCPFAHLGLLAIVEECARRHSDVTLRVRSWPLELVNGRPLDAVFIAEEVDEIRPQIPPGRFRNFSSEAFPGSTMAAMELSVAAYDIDDRTGQAVALALRDALFEQGINVGEPEALAKVAADHGVPWPPDAAAATSLHQRVRDDWAEGVGRGVVGSPHFFTSDGGFFCPALDISRDQHGHLNVATDDMFTSFVDGLLGPGASQ